MTTGSVGVPKDSVLVPTYVGIGFHKSWSGTDGKYEAYAGGLRSKWNNYSVEIQSRNRNTNQANISYWNCPPSPDPAPPDDLVPVGVSINGFGAELEWTTADTLKLQSKLLRKVKGHDFNLAVNLAQMGQVSSMVVHNLGSLGRAFLALRHGDFATAARTLGAKPRTSRLKPSDVSGRWLELQYGWLPTISDTYAAVKAFHEISRGPRSALIRTSVGKKAEIEGSTTPSQYSQKYNMELKRYIQYEMYEEMSVQRQLGLVDPLTVAWELIPYSFVVDWFVPIGTYLDNLNGIPNLKGRFLTTTVTRRRGYTLFRGIQSPYSCFGVKVRHTGPKDKMRTTKVDRVFSNSLEVPRPSFKLDGAVHGRRIWNAIALTQQRFSLSPKHGGGSYRPRGPRIHLFRGSKLI